MFPRVLAAAVLLASAAHASTWTLAADSHFEVYSQRGEVSARETLAWFARLRALLIRETGLRPDRLRPARVVGFASEAEYRPYRLHSDAEAYYAGTEGRDYIVMALDSPRAAGIAAHEYAHMAIHSAGVELPPWLAEGLAEVFGTLRISDDGTVLGGDRPEHSQFLRRTPWTPLAALLRVRESAAETPAFYAQAWALTDMLARSPDYGFKLRALAAALAALSPEGAFASVYGRTLNVVEADLHTWVERRRAAPPLRFAGLATESAAVSVSEVAPVRTRVLLAQLLLDGGEQARAETLFRDLLRDAPEAGDAHAALGTIAAARGDREEARERWTRALRLGVSDDALCYRYVAIAPAAGLSDADLRPVLDQAVAIRPDFDDARFSLALMEKNAGHEQAALDHLRAMRPPAPARAFAWWTAVFDALHTLNREDEAEAAARSAGAHAASDAERVRAAEMIWLAQTELVVQLAPGAEGRPRMVTTRVPRRRSEWNPFIEPQDEIRTVEGELREIDCSGTVTRMVVETASGRQALAIPDPAKVLMRNAPDEFTCGPQQGEMVSVVYALAGAVVRGIEFRR